MLQRLSQVSAAKARQSRHFDAKVEREEAWRRKVTKDENLARKQRVEAAKEAKASSLSRADRDRGVGYGEEVSRRNIVKLKAGKNTPKALREKERRQPVNNDWMHMINFDAMKFHEEQAQEKIQEKERQRAMRSFLDEQNAQIDAERSANRAKAIEEGRRIRQAQKESDRQAKENLERKKEQQRKDTEKRIEDEEMFEAKARERQRRKIAVEKREVQRIQQLLQDEQDRKEQRKQQLKEENEKQLLELERQKELKALKRQQEDDESKRLHKDYIEMEERKAQQRAEAWAKMQAAQNRNVAMGEKVYEILAKQQKDKETNQNETIEQHNKQKEQEAKDRDRRKLENNLQLQRELKAQVEERNIKFHQDNKTRLEQEARRVDAAKKEIQAERKRQAERRRERVEQSQLLKKQLEEDALNRIRERGWCNGTSIMSDIERKLNRKMIQEMEASS